MDYAEIVTMAGKLGIRGMTAQALREYEPQSDGLSGGVSSFYACLNKLISCHKAGVAHDWLYERGGTMHDRLKADRLFCFATAMSGKFIPGWLEDWFSQWAARPWKQRLINARNGLVWWLPFARRGWRVFRALLMYTAVRLFGWRYWGTK